MRRMTCGVLFLLLWAAVGRAEERPRPLMREFMGLNVHTVKFKPAVYAPVCRLLRDYHPLRWDVGEDPSFATTFPFAKNRVDWGSMYGSWEQAGFEIDACVMFDDLPPAAWKDPARDALAYGEAFARYFGPSGAKPLVSSIEIGNEPAKYDTAQYRSIFEGMAKGIRAGDSKLAIATCAVMTGKSDQWSKPMEAVAGLGSLYDVLNVHSYPFKDKWPTWRRSYPEDPSISFLSSITDLIQWRDANAPGKQVWLTEFGYDSSTRKPNPKGPWKDWVGVSDAEQARYIVRAFLVLSSMPVDRAYLYFFDDKDEPQLHGASGITRNYEPKPSFYAMSYLYKTLGSCRFVRAVRKDPKVYCFEYQDPTPGGEHVYVAWSPTGSGRSSNVVLPTGAAKVIRAERMPLGTNAPHAVQWKSDGDRVEVEITETPVFLRTN